MSMIDHIRRSMKGEPSPPRLNEIKSLGEKPIAIAPQPVSSIDAKIKALIESKKQQMNEIMEAPLGKETTGAPVPSMDNFSVKGKGKPKMVNGNGNAQPPEVDGQEQVELGGITPVDLKPETKDITTKDLRKEGVLSALSSIAAKSLPKKATPHIAAAHDAFVKADKDFVPAKTVKGGLGAAGKFIAKKIGAHVANELGKTVGISGSTITGTISALASGGAKKSKVAKAGKSTTTMGASDKPTGDGHTPPPNPMSAGKGKSKKSTTVKGAVAGGGEPEKMTPDQYRKEQGLAPRGKAKPGTAPESSTSKGATLMSKDSLFKQKSTNNDNEKKAHQPKFDKGGSHTTMNASPGEYGKKLNKEFPVPPRQPKTSNNPMSAKSSSKASSGSTNRISSNLKNRMMSSTASASTASNPMSAKPSSMSAKMSSGVGALDRFKNANRMKIKKINEELLELVKLIESQNRFNQPPAMGEYSADEHLDKMVDHHNRGLQAKAAGDRTKARVHFLTRNHHFAHYAEHAPDNLDIKKIRAMLDVMEDITPLDKVMEIRRRLIAA